MNLQVSEELRYHFIPLGWLSSKQTQKTRKRPVAAKMWRNWTPCTAAANVKWCSCCGKQYGVFFFSFFKLSIELFRNCTSDYTLQIIESKDSNRYGPPMLIAALFPQQKGGTTQLSACRRMDKENVVDPYKVVQTLKGMEFWHMLQDGWNLRTVWIS